MLPWRRRARLWVRRWSPGSSVSGLRWRLDQGLTFLLVGLWDLWVVLHPEWGRSWLAVVVMVARIVVALLLRPIEPPTAPSAPAGRDGTSPG